MRFKQRLFKYLILIGSEILTVAIGLFVLLQIDHWLLYSSNELYSPKIPNLIRDLNKVLLVLLNIFWAIKIFQGKTFEKVFAGVLLSGIFIGFSKISLF